MTIGILLLAIALAEFALGLWFIFAYRRQQSTFWYGLFAIGAASYVGSNGLGFLLDNFYIAERLGWAGGALLTSFFLPFSFSFPIPRRSAREMIPWVVWPIIIFVFGTIFTDLFIKDQGIISYRAGYQTSVGPLFWFYLLFFGVYWTWSIANLISRRLESDGIHRWQLNMLLLGVLASLTFSVAFDIVLPLVAVSNFGYVGSLFSTVWLGFTSYILVKK